jgi:hypothetical protein
MTALANVGVISGVAGDVAVLDQSGPRRFRMGLTLEFPHRIEWHCCAYFWRSYHV